MRLFPAFAALAAVACSSSEPVAPPKLALDERLPAGRARAGVIERPEELLVGDTAKGRVGDFKLYNDRVAVVVAQIGFGGYQPFGGTILDADRVRPAGEAGRSTFGEVVAAFDLTVTKPDAIAVINDGRDGGAAIVRVTGHSAELPLLSALLGSFVTRDPEPLGITIDYVLEPDRDWMEVVYTLSNPLRGPRDVGAPMTGYMFGDGAQPFTPGAGFATPDPGVRTPYYGATGPQVSYLYGRKGADLQFVLGVSGLLLATAGDSFTLRGKESTQIRHVLVVGDGDLGNTQQLWHRATEQAELVPMTGRVLDAMGEPVIGARVHVTRPEAASEEYGYATLARTDLTGAWRALVQGGEPYDVQAISEAYVRSEVRRVESLGEPVALTLQRPGTVRYAVTGEDGAPLPAKLSFVQDTDNGRLPGRFGEPSQPNGVLRVEYGITGSGTLELPAGGYTAYVSRGNEYEIVEAHVEVSAERVAEVNASLVRSVATPGYLSTDTHVHSQLSPDSPDLVPFKVKAMVVEGLEIPVSTEHEWIGDFNPSIRALGLGEWIHGIIGSEITTFTYGHFNAFPLVGDATKPGNGRLPWVGLDPKDTFAAIHANAGQPFLQVNHPRSAALGGYFSAMGYDASTGAASAGERWSPDFDGIEVANGCGVEFIESETMKDWFSFLNRGQKKVAMGSTDSHHAGKGEMGYPKTYLAMPTDRPSEAKIDDVRKAAKEGRALISCGPFLDLKLGAAGVGDTARVTGDLVEVTATLRAPSWLSVRQVELVVNGEVAKIASIAPVEGALDVNVTMTASVTPGRDAWVMARARGPGAGRWFAQRARPYAFTNAIYVDGDRDGAWTMQR